jgi:hypothetical protein
MPLICLRRDRCERVSGDATGRRLCITLPSKEDAEKRPTGIAAGDAAVQSYAEEVNDEEAYSVGARTASCDFRRAKHFL